MFSVIGRNARYVARTMTRASGHERGGVPGDNLPFDIHNPYKLTLYFGLFCGSAIGLPFFVVRHQLLKQ